MFFSAMLRSESGLRPLTSSLRVWGVWAALVVAFAAPVLAVEDKTPAGTRITNVATVVYSTSTGVTGRAEGSADFVVGHAAGVDIEPPLTSLVLPGAEVVLPHVLRNIGNAADTFDIQAATARNWPTRIFHDVDGNGRLSAADTLITGGIALGMDEVLPILAVVDIPTGMARGDREPLSIVAVSRFDGSVSDEVIDDLRSADPNLDVSITKDVDRTEASEGDLLTYDIQVRIEGTGERGSAVVTDEIPEHTTYAAGTLKLDGVPVTDATDEDEGSFDPARGILTVDVSDLPDATTATIQFQVRVNVPTAAGTQIQNTAAIDIKTPFGNLTMESHRAITRVAAPSLEITKTVTGPERATVGDSLLYVIEVANPSATLGAVNLEVIDTLPDHLTLRRATPAPSVAGNILTWQIASLEPSTTARFEVLVEVDDVSDSTVVVNHATLTRQGMTDGHAESGPITLTAGDTASLALDLEAEALEVQIGSTLPLRVTVENDGLVTVTDLTVRIVMPRATRFVDQILQGAFNRLGSTAAPANAAQAVDGPIQPIGTGGLTSEALQLDSVRIVGDTLIVHVPGQMLPTESFSFRYLLLVANGASGVLVNEASAEGRRGNVLAIARGRVVASNDDEVPVVLERNRPLETRTVIGKVFVDDNNNGRQDDGENGLQGIDVWTEDGSLSTTDEYGKFSFVNLRPGSHAFRLDPASLPVDVRVAGSGPERGMQVLETNGWTSGRVSFPLVSRRARVADARVPTGANAASCTALEGRLGTDVLSCAPAGDVAQLDLAALLLGVTEPTDPTVVTASGEATPADSTAAPLAPVTLVRFEADSAGLPEAAFELPTGWTWIPGSGSVDGSPVEPLLRTTPEGGRWLVWEAVPAATAELSVLLVEGTVDVGSLESVTVEPLRTAEERADAEASAFITGPTVSIFTPIDGHVAATNRLYVGARGEAQKPVSLFRGDSLITESEFRPDGIQDFIGMELAEGPQTFRVQTTNSFGNVVWDSITVHRSGAPARLAPESERVSVVADGRTPSQIRVRIFDRWDVPVVNRPLVTLRSDVGRILGTDQDLSSVGHQIRADADGWATFEMVGPREPGSALLLVTAQDADAQIELDLLPPIRPLILTGLGRFSVGAGGQNFGALTARGRLDERTSLTLSYDSRRLDQGRDVFGNSSDPLEDGRYSIIGDASQERQLSASRYNFAASLERGLDHLTFGDVQTQEFSAGMELARYGRALPGASARVATGGVVWNAFGASTAQALRQIQIRGSGTSGPFALDGGILPGTEQVRIEIRARENPTRAISEQSLTRYVEYQIDYEFGSLLLKQPLPSTDALGNPVFLVLSYEAESGGERSSVYGVRASSDLQALGGELIDSIPVSFSVVRDAQVGQEFTMGAAQVGLVQQDGARLTAEMAVADNADGRDVATRIEGKMPLFAGRVSLGGMWSRVGDDFRNPGNIALQAGAEEVRASADVRLGTANVTFAHERQKFSQRGIERSRTTVGVTQALRSNLNLEARFAGDGAESTGLASSSGAGEYKLTWKATEKLELSGEARNQLWSEGGLATAGSRVGAGASYALSRYLSLDARHFEVAPAGGVSSYAVSSLGITSQVRAGTKAWSSYQLLGGADGQTNAAVVGLNHQFAVGSDWRFQTMMERRVGVAGASPTDPILASPFDRPEEDYTSGSLGMEFVPQGKPYRLSLRGEAKDGTRLSSKIATLAGDLSLGGSLALLSRQEFVQQDQQIGGSQRYTESRSSLWGLAFRPATTDAFNVLFKFHFKDGINPNRVGVLTQDGEERRLIGALEAIWAPTARFEWATRFAARTASAAAPTIGGLEQTLTSETRFLGSAATVDVTGFLGLKVEARGMFTPNTAGVWDVSPSMLFRPFDGLQIESGYRFGTLEDPDFAVKAGKGFFLTFGTRITEQTLPTAADFWRNRFGN